MHKICAIPLFIMYVHMWITFQLTLFYLKPFLTMQKTPVRCKNIFFNVQKIYFLKIYQMNTIICTQYVQCTYDQPGSEIQFLLTPFYAQQQNVNPDRLCKYVILCCRAFLGRLRGFSISEGLFGPGFSKSGAE